MYDLRKCRYQQRRPQQCDRKELEYTPPEKQKEADWPSGETDRDFPLLLFERKNDGWESKVIPGRWELEGTGPRDQVLDGMTE